MKLTLKRKLLLSALIGYTSLVVYWMLWGFGRTSVIGYRYNLVPFSTIVDFFQVEHFNAKIVIINLLGNIGVFMPFGLLLPLIFKFNLRQTLIVGLIGLLILETAQLITGQGVFDVDDLILNTLGITLGYCLYRLCDRNK